MGSRVNVMLIVHPIVKYSSLKKNNNMTQDIESMYLHEIIIFGQVVGPRLQFGG